MSKNRLASIIFFTTAVLGLGLRLFYDFLGPAKSLSVGKISVIYFLIQLVFAFFIWKDFKKAKIMYTIFYLVNLLMFVLLMLPGFSSVGKHLEPVYHGHWGTIFKVYTWFDGTCGFLIFSLLNLDYFGKYKKAVLALPVLLVLTLPVIHFWTVRSSVTLLINKLELLKQYGIIITIDRTESNWDMGTIEGKLTIQDTQPEWKFKLNFDQWTPYVNIFDWPTYKYEGQIFINGMPQSFTFTLGKSSVQKIKAELKNLLWKTSAYQIEINKVDVNFTSITFIHTGRIVLNGLKISRPEKSPLTIGEFNHYVMLNSNEDIDLKQTSLDIEDIFYNGNRYEFKTDINFEDDKWRLSQTVLGINNERPFIISGS